MYPEPGLCHPGLHPGLLHPVRAHVRPGGDLRNRPRGVQRGLRPLGHRGGEGGGQEPQRGQGDDQVHGRGGNSRPGGQWPLDHAKWRGQLFGENKVIIKLILFQSIN